MTELGVFKMVNAIIPVMTFWKSLLLSSRTRFGIWAFEERGRWLLVRGWQEQSEVGSQLNRSPFAEKSI